MTPLDLGSTMLALFLVGGGAVLGLGAAVMAFGARIPEIRERERTRGYFQGLAAARAHDTATYQPGGAAPWKHRRAR